MEMFLSHFVWIFLFGSFSSINGQGRSETCNQIMTAAGLDLKNFASDVAHGIHSLYLEPLRYFFEPSAGEFNGIPVVNMNLSQSNQVLINSPLAGYDSSIKSISLRTMDFVFKNDAADFLIGQLTTVEKLGHSFHMHELWTKAQPIYKSLKAEPWTNAADICGCVNMDKENGVLAALLDVSNYLKKFGSKKQKAWFKHYFHCGLFGYKCTVNNKAANLRKDVESSQNTWTPGTMTGSSGWNTYKGVLESSMISDAGIKMLAQFLYCKLNV